LAGQFVLLLGEWCWLPAELAAGGGQPDMPGENSLCSFRAARTRAAQSPGVAKSYDGSGGLRAITVG
jgi:hypothetical protein